MTAKSDNGIFGYCFVCGKPLGQDDVYGPDDMDLCREHHEKFYQAVELLEKWAEPQAQAEPQQLSLFGVQ